MNNQLTPTQENYLVAVYELEQENRVARVGEIAKALAVGLSSVSSALRILADKGLLNYSPHNFITLTGEGLSLSRRLVARREVMLDFLQKILALPAAVAERNAGLLENTIDEEVYERLLAFVDFIRTCPRTGDEWLADFRNRWVAGKSQDCLSCMEKGLGSLFCKSEVESGKSVAPPLTLADLQAGDLVQVVALRNAGRRLAELGLLPGAVVRVEKFAPLGDPCEISLNGARLTLRREDAVAVAVEPL
ncbi:MAG: FeoA domain-containing protein [Deltaproteobacteria bacterium]|nr:FeoA domain-containing protein [Deltaproteobacteria bacterium]